MSDGAGELGDLLARARRDGASPERLAAVRARLETQLGPLDVPPSPATMAMSSKVALGVAALAAAIGIAAWLAAQSDAPVDEGRGTSTRRVEDPNVPGTSGRDPSGRDPSVQGPGVQGPSVRGPSGRDPSVPDPSMLPSAPESGVETATGQTEPMEARSGAASAPPTAGSAARSERAQAARNEARTGAASAPTAPSAAQSERAQVARDEREPRAATATAPGADPSSSLREEIALLDRAIRARDSGDVARAVATLEAHRARFPSGVLRPERDRMLAELASPAPAPPPPP
jgi:TolA-binding protein